MSHAGNLLKAGGGAVAVGGVICACVRHPDYVLDPVEQGTDWMDRFQPESDWWVRVRLRSRGIEANRVVLKFDRVEVRDSCESSTGFRRSMPIPLQVAHGTEPKDQWVVVPPGGAVRGEHGGMEVRRLRISGFVRAWRRWHLPRTTRFDFDMDQASSFRGEQVVR